MCSSGIRGSVQMSRRNEGNPIWDQWQGATHWVRGPAGPGTLQQRPPRLAHWKSASYWLWGEALSKGVALGATAQDHFNISAWYLYPVMDLDNKCKTVKTINRPLLWIVSQICREKRTCVRSLTTSFGGRLEPAAQLWSISVPTKRCSSSFSRGTISSLILFQYCHANVTWVLWNAVKHIIAGTVEVQDCGV